MAEHDHEEPAKSAGQNGAKTQRGVKPSAYGAMRADGTGGIPSMPGHIYFFVRTEHEKSPVPKEQEEARQQLENMCKVLRIVFFDAHKKLFDEQFGRLLTIAQGVFTPNGFRLEPLNDLSHIKEEIFRTAGAAVKAKYLWRMARTCLTAASIIFVSAALLHFLDRYVVAQGWFDGDSSGLRVSVFNTGCLLATAMVGLFFASCVRNMEITFETLILPDADLAAPWIRVVFFGIAIFIMALLFQAKVLTVAIGNVSTASIADSPVVAIVVGLLLGVAERAVPKEAIRWSEKLFTKDNSV
jgi:hypothetical protein